MKKRYQKPDVEHIVLITQEDVTNSDSLLDASMGTDDNIFENNEM